MEKKTEKKNEIKKPDEAVKYASKAYVKTIIVVMWISIALCLFSWLPDFQIFGWFSSKIIGIIGGALAIASIFVLLLTVKCPHCGKKKLGRVVGLRIQTEVECPDCHKKVIFK